jgi:hypothetical protein
MGQVDSSASVEPLQQLPVGFIAAGMPKADQVQRGLDRKLEVVRLAYPTSELLRQGHVQADMVLQTLEAVIANDEP